MVGTILSYSKAKSASEVTDLHVPGEACGLIPRRKYWLDHRLKNPVKYLLKNAKYRARLKGLLYDISEEDVIIPSVCPVLGIPLFYIEECKGKYQNGNAPSLDRIDPAKGYTKDNIRIISWRANMLKKDMSLKEAELIYQDAVNNSNRFTHTL